MENRENYKVVNGTYYHKETNDNIIRVLENARNTKSRIRIFYGDRDTGKCWYEEHDIIGYIGRSTGSIKVPLIISNKRSIGGHSLLTQHIIRITIDKKDVYKHTTFNVGDLTIVDTSFKALGKTYLYRVIELIDYEGHFRGIANFETLQKAQNYIEFLEGKRNRV